MIRFEPVAAERIEVLRREVMVGFGVLERSARPSPRRPA